jgi:putative ABC transport system permease protein
MRALHIKLFRDLRRLRAQVLAIALVMAAGVATMILGVGTYDSLSQTRARYYEANRFADIFANVTRAPKDLVPEIAAIDGVIAVEPRIVKLAVADIDGMVEPASALLVSLPGLHDPALNRLYLRSGRFPEPGRSDEAVISEGFAKAHGLQPGSAFHVLINGRRRSIRVTGLALSPEFIYALGPGDLMPDERRFGVVWMPEKTLAVAYDLDGAFSNVVVKLVPGTLEPQVMEKLDALLAHYGGQGAYGRKDQTSHAFLDAELQQLKAMSRILPPIFLVVSAFLVSMTLSRLIALEREQIGLLKALGYSSWAIAQHYVEFVSLIALIGIILGTAAGVWLGNGLTSLYARFFNFPFLIFSRSPSIYAITACVTVGAALIGAIKAVGDAAWLPPAVAMQPPAPPRYRKAFSGLVDLTHHFRQSAVMVSRHLLHWWRRTATSVLGIAFAVAILVGSLCSFGSVEQMIDVTFRRADREDATINFTEKRPASAAYEIERLPGILVTEPYRAVPVKLRNSQVERRVLVMGSPSRTDLSRVLDAAFRPVRLPETGIMLSAALADILRARVGDAVQMEILEGNRRAVDVPVTAITQGYLGLTAYMDIEALNRLLREDNVISGVHVSIDDTQMDRLFAVLKNTPAANFIALHRVSLKKFRETLAQNVHYQVITYASLAIIIAFGVVYNFARISLSEQGRELASLRVLGFTRSEVSGLLLSEIAVVVLTAQPLGWLIGYGLAYVVFAGFATELYRVPLVVGSEVYAYASIVVIAAAIASGAVVRRRVEKLDMIAVLKTRE